MNYCTVLLNTELRNTAKWSVAMKNRLLLWTQFCLKQKKDCIYILGQTSDLLVSSCVISNNDNSCIIIIM